MRLRRLEIGDYWGYGGSFWAKWSLSFLVDGGGFLVWAMSLVGRVEVSHSRILCSPLGLSVSFPFSLLLGELFCGFAFH